jgi:WD40 repeat protein
MKLFLCAPIGTLAALAALGLAAVPAAHAQQTLYVTNFSDSTITQFNSVGVGTQFNQSGDLTGPNSLAFNSAGNLFVSSSLNNTVEEFNSAGVGTQFNISGDVNEPGALAFNSAGDLFVANTGDSTIEDFNSQGFGTRFNTSGDVNQPSSLAFYPSSLPAAVPEASTTVSLGLLLALGLGGIVVAAKRRKRA